MKMTGIEKETIILFNEAERTAEVETYNQRLIRKLDNNCKDFPNEYVYLGERAGAKRYRLLKKRINFTRPRP